MLTVARSIAPPAVIGDDGQDIGPIAYIPGHELTINAFITYGGRDPIQMIRLIERRTLVLSRIAGRRAAKLLEPGIKEMQEGWQGFYSRHQLRLMVESD